MKKWLGLFFAIVCLWIAYEWGSTWIDKEYFRRIESGWQQPSPFTQDKVLESQEVEEGKTIVVLYNYKPLVRGHLLILPKRHVERLEELTPEEWAEIKVVIERMHLAFEGAYQASDYVLFLQNGLYAGQTVPHVHFHLLPKKNDAVVATKFQIWKTALSETLGLRAPLPADELQAEIDYLKTHLPRNS